MRALSMLVLCTLLAAPALAQERRGPGGRGSGMAMPEQWVPFDSLVLAVAVSDAQRPEVARLHAELDTLMQRGAALRRQAREEMQGSRNMDRMRSLRDQLDFLQQDVARKHQAIRKLLSAEQHAAFDALRAPRVVPERRRRG